MAQVVTEIDTQGPPLAVFDLVTTPKYWPQWHPATVGVGGVTDRPIQLGDVIRERAQIGPNLHEGDWTVVEYARPTRVVLQMAGGALQITYIFAATDRITRFRRQLDYPPGRFGGSGADPTLVQRLMEEQSAEGLRRLKNLVEKDLMIDK
jgi:hypothetical protein